MKKYQAKQLIKEIIREIYRGRRNLLSSGTYDDYEIELNGLNVPGYLNPTDSVIANVTIEYEASPGHEPRGMFGPPENAEPGAGASIESLDFWLASFKVTTEQGQETEYDNLSKIQPELLEPIKKAVADYMHKHERDIDEMILNKIDFNPPEPDYDRDKDRYYSDR